MKEILGIVSKIMAVFGFAAVVWKIAVWVDNKGEKVVSTESIVKAVQTEFQSHRDSIYKIVETINQGVEATKDEVVITQQKQENLQRSYVLHLQADRKYEELIKFLQGYEFNLNRISRDSVRFDSKITKGYFNKNGEWIVVETIK